MLYTLILLLSGVILNLTIYEFYTLLFGRNVYNKKLTFFTYCISYCFTTVALFLATPVTVNVIASIITMFLIALTYKVDITVKIIYTLFSFLVVMIADVMMPFVAGAVLQLSIEELLQNQHCFLIMLIIVRIVPYIIALCLRFFIAKNTHIERNSLKHSDFALALIVPISTIITLHLLTDNARFRAASEHSFYVAMVIAVIILNSVFFFVYIQNLRLATIETNAKLLDRQIEYYNSQFDIIKQYVEDIKRFKHDMKHMLLSTYSEESNDNKRKIIKKVDDLFDEVEYFHYLEYTKNRSIDVLLNYYIVRSKKEGIDIEYKIDVQDIILIDSKNVCALLGNALDNSIEAASKTKKKYIHVHMTIQNDNLYIDVINPYTNLIKYSNQFLTTKEDGINHGIGLKSIRYIASEYDGYVHIDTSKNVFTLQVLMVNKSLIG